MIDNSKAVMSALDRAKRNALEQIGIKAQNFAVKLCPVGTPESTGIPGYRGGTLRQSIKYKVKSDNSNDCVFLGTNVHYAPYQELGFHTVNGKWAPAANGGKGFLRPAAYDHASLYKKIVKDCMKNVL